MLTEALQDCGFPTTPELDVPHFQAEAIGTSPAYDPFLVRVEDESARVVHCLIQEYRVRSGMSPSRTKA
jgi:hypothetical protein